MRNLQQFSVMAAVLFGAAQAHASEPVRGCFHSVGEAVTGRRTLDTAQTHLPETHTREVTVELSASAKTADWERDGGVRVLAVRRDPFVGRTWATVASCTHPEQPSRTVEIAGAAAEVAAATGNASGTAAAGSAPVVVAGTTARVVLLSNSMRMEMSGVPQSNAGLGERVRVRLLRPDGSATAAEQLVTAVVRGSNLLELENE